MWSEVVRTVGNDSLFPYTPECCLNMDLLRHKIMNLDERLCWGEREIDKAEAVAPARCRKASLLACYWLNPRSSHFRYCNARSIRPSGAPISYHSWRDSKPRSQISWAPSLPLGSVQALHLSGLRLHGLDGVTVGDLHVNLL